MSKKVVIAQYGGPEVLEIIERPVPEPKAGEVLIRNMATTVSIGDVWIRNGQLAPPFRKKAPKSPITPGSEVVGIVEKTGTGVSAFRPGQLVAALAGNGYSEHVCVDQAGIVSVPDGIEPDDAACLSLNYVLAYRMLQAAKLRGGGAIVVLGASGTIGTALLQLGKISGLNMIGTASRTKHDFVSSLAAIPIDYKDVEYIQKIKNIHSGGVDAVFDGAAADIGKSYGLLNKNGRLIVYGFESPKPKQIIPRLMQLMALRFIPDGKKAAFYSLLYSHKKNPQVWKEDMAILFQLLLDQSIRPIIAHRFPLEDIQTAHKTLEQGTIPGRIILTTV